MSLYQLSSTDLDFCMFFKSSFDFYSVDIDMKFSNDLILIRHGRYELHDVTYSFSSFTQIRALTGDCQRCKKNEFFPMFEILQILYGSQLIICILL